MQPKLPGVLFVLAALGVACPPPTVVVRDDSGTERQVTVQEAARLTWQGAQNDLQAGRKAEAREKLQAVVEKYPSSDYLDKALDALGDLAASENDHATAADYFRRLVLQMPASPLYQQAAVKMGLELARAGRTAEAVPTLQSVFDRLNDERQKAEVAGLLAENFRQAGEDVEALRWFSVLHRLSRVPGAAAVIEEQVLELIDGMDFRQVRAAYELFRQQELADWPMDLLVLKLGKIFYHILDFDRARQHLEYFAGRWPGHERLAEAAALLQKIEKRQRVNPLAIGVLLPLSGEFEAYGKKAWEGIQLGAGLFDSPPLADAPTFVVRDTKGDAQTAVEQLEDLVFNEQVIAVIGPMMAKETYAAAMKAEELQVPLITLSIRQDVVDVGRWVLRNFLTIPAQARTLVSYAMEKLSARRFALLYPNDWYGVEFANALWDEIERRQGEVRGAESYEPDQKNFAEPVKKLVGRYHLEARWDFVVERNRIRKEAKSALERQRAMDKLLKKLPPVVDFEVLFVPDYVEKVVLIAPALAVEDIILHTESKWQIERLKKSLDREKLDMIYLMGGNGWNDPRLIEWAERYVQGAIFCDGFFLESSRPATRAFVEKFRARFERDPSIMEAHAYDTAQILRQIIKDKKPANRGQMLERLLEMRDYDGATGRTSFTKNGEVEKELFLLTVDKDVIREVSPADANAPRS
jgi:branched-chain amino acid transport system substrate-binding protein